MNKLNIGKTLTTIIVLNLLQVTAVLVVLLFALSPGESGLENGQTLSVSLLLCVILVSVFFSTYMALRSKAANLLRDRSVPFLQETLTRLEALNRTLRAQRHDFLNHLQVVYSLMEMDEYKDAREYIERIYHDIQKVNRVMKTAHPAINAILQAKVLQCEKLGIGVELNVSSTLNDLPVPSWEFCRVLGNLLDNSMHALEEKPESGQIRIELSEDLKNYRFAISNNGPEIPNELRGRIFEAGFTTRQGKGEGMGLAIIRETLEEHGGAIQVRSENGFTRFEGTIPRLESSAP